MRSSSMQPIEPNVRDVVEPLINNTIIQTHAVFGGKNSRVYKLVTENNAQFAVKFCTDVTRLTREFSSFEFLISHGFQDVPTPVVVAPKQLCAIYQFVDGTPLKATDIGTIEIDQAVSFLERLKKLSDCSESRELSQASEACFSIAEIADNIQFRFERLLDVASSGSSHTELHKFLVYNFEPGLKTVYTWVQNQARVFQISLDDILSITDQTLSPSDFGFHNVLRCSNGSLVFLDFEHFGWDDPAKLISDFLLHPHDVMRFSKDFKRHFLKKTLAAFSQDATLTHRLELVFPLFGLKWCTILLNEFVPKDLERRSFAQAATLDQAAIQHRQLLKADDMLKSVLETYSNFSIEYHL